jgi:carboxyl-terminal processing protease
MRLEKNMVSRRFYAISVAIAVVCTAMLTFSLTTLFQFNIGDKSVVPTSEYKALLSQSKEFDKAVELRRFIEKNYYKDTSKVDFESGIIKGIFESLNDPYSTYFTAEEFKKFNEDTSGEYAGIGIVIEPTDDGLITVVSPIEGSPAYKIGVKSNDKIIKVDGKEVSAKNFEEAVSMMRGKPGTDVVITVVRKGEAAPVEFKITREIVKIKAVTSKNLGNGLGYIRINSFDNDVAKQFETNLDSLLKSGAKGLVIDLRGNPGGALDQCIEIADRILGKALIVYTKDRQGVEDKAYSDENTKLSMPVTVLVDGGSASASEILTGAVKDNHAGTIIGEKTFGKGIVQSVYTLDGGTGMKLTTSEYFTPSGKNIHKIGITPDILIKDDPKTEVDEQLQKAETVLLSKIK